MEKLTLNDLKVKSHNEIISLLSCFCPDADFWTTKTVDNDTFSYPSFYDDCVAQGKCGAWIPNQMAVHKCFSNYCDIDYNKSYNLLNFFRKDLEKGLIPDSDLRKALHIVSNQIKIIEYEDEKGNSRFFTSYTKGTERYAKIQSFQAMDYIKDHVNAGWQAFFLTLTCDPKKYANRLDAWENYKENEIKPVLENFRKHKGLEYIGFMESTAKGYPHIHLMLFFPRGTFNGYDKMKNRQVLYFGELFREIQKKRFSAQTKLIVVKGEGVQHYLTKYVTKGNEGDLLKLEHKKNSFTKEERKLLLGLICTKACKVRTKICCKNRASSAVSHIAKELRKPQYNYKGFARAFVKKVRQGSLSDRDFSRLREVLKRLCTNSPLKCNHCFNQANLSHFNDLYKKSHKEISLADDITKAKFQKISARVGCSGCFFTHFIHFVLYNDDDLINRRFYFSVKDNIYTKITDGYDLNNDKDWYYCMQNIITFFFTGFADKTKDFLSLAIGAKLVY